MKIDPFSKIQIQILKKAHVGLLGSFECKKFSLMGIFSLVGTNMT